MQNFFIKYLISYISILLFFSCASINAPSGGPIDTTPPFLLADEIVPTSNTNIKKNQTIKLFFNERIDPNTILGSITIEPETDIIITNSNNFIFIKPEDEWPNQFRIFISRQISDYFNNYLNFPIDLLFSRLDTIYNKQIYGSLFNIDTTKIYEVALLDSNASIFSKTESNAKGEYSFSGLQNYSFDLIVAIEGQISDDILFDVRHKRYGISNRGIRTTNNPIFMADPIYRSEINNIVMINSQYGKINLTNNTNLNVIFNNGNLREITEKNEDYLYYNHNFKDSLFINESVSNHIENYTIDKSMLLSDEVLDTLPPFINKQYVRGDSSLIEFNEPVLINNKRHPFYYIDGDSNNNIIDYDYLSPTLLYLDNHNQLEIINVNCSTVTDLAFNFLCDSLLLISDILKDEEDNFSYGEINGEVIYNGDKNLIIQAKKIDTGKISRKKIVANKFKFDKLLSGNYQISVYEDINPVGESYFSGTLDPIQYSAKFFIYHKDIYVRENWSNTIRIQLK